MEIREIHPFKDKYIRVKISKLYAIWFELEEGKSYWYADIYLIQ